MKRKLCSLERIKSIEWDVPLINLVDDEINEMLSDDDTLEQIKAKGLLNIFESFSEMDCVSDIDFKWLLNQKQSYVDNLHNERLKTQTYLDCNDILGSEITLRDGYNELVNIDKSMRTQNLMLQKTLISTTHQYYNGEDKKNKFINIEQVVVEYDAIWFNFVGYGVMLNNFRMENNKLNYDITPKLPTGNTFDFNSLQSNDCEVMESGYFIYIVVPKIIQDSMVKAMINLWYSETNELHIRRSSYFSHYHYLVTEFIERNKGFQSIKYFDDQINAKYIMEWESKELFHIKERMYIDDKRVKTIKFKASDGSNSNNAIINMLFKFGYLYFNKLNREE